MNQNKCLFLILRGIYLILMAMKATHGLPSHKTMDDMKEFLQEHDYNKL